MSKPRYIPGITIATRFLMTRPTGLDDGVTASALPQQVVGHRLVSWQRGRIDLRILGGRVGSKTDDDHLSGRVDIDRLPMYASRGEGAVLVVDQPPHASVAATLQCLVTGFFEVFLADATLGSATQRLFGTGSCEVLIDQGTTLALRTSSWTEAFRKVTRDARP